MQIHQRAAIAFAVLGLLGGVAARPAAAQARDASRVVTGVVTDAGTGAGVAEAVIEIPAARLRATTDAAGAYRIAGVPAGRVEVRIRRIGYRPVSVPVAVSDSAITTLDVGLQPAATELAPVVVTGTREPRSLADIPASVSVADSTTLKSGRTAGLHEVLRYVPGVQATSRYGLDDVNLSIRGSGVRTSFGVRGVAVIVDGVPVTEPDGQTRLDLVELGSARQVEVVRGPSSALYGGSASGGAINIISRSGAESRGITGRVQGGSFGFRKYDGSAGATFAGDRGNVYASGSYTWTDGFRAHNTNDMVRLNLRSAYRVAPATSIGVEASTSNLDMKIPGALTMDEFDRDPGLAQPITVTNDYGRQDQRYRAGLRLDQDLDLGAPVTTNTYFFYGGRELWHPIFQLLDQNLHRVQLGHRARIPVGGADGRVRVVVGADYDNVYGSDRRHVNQGGRPGALVSDQRISLPNLGVYGQVEGDVTDRVTLTGGVRYDRVRYHIEDLLRPERSVSPGFDELSPKGTVAYRIAPGTSAYVSVARGFEPPTSGELTASPDSSEAFNTSLEPQRLVNYEVGVKTLVADRLFLDVALFRTDIEGEFLTRTVLIGGQPRTVYQNAGDSRHLGLEVGWTALVTDRLDLVGGYAYSDFVLKRFTGSVVNSAGQSVPTDFSGNRLPGVPVHRLSGEVRYRPLIGLSLGLGAEWQSRVYVDNANTAEGTLYLRGFGAGAGVTQVPFRAVSPYALMHLNASYQWRGTTFFASVENLFDRTYVGSASLNASDGRFYSAGAGRYLAVGMSLTANGGLR